MKVCRGCLGLLLFLALLAPPIELRRRVFGWSDAETSRFELAWCGLLWIAASVRQRASPTPADVLRYTRYPVIVEPPVDVGALHVSTTPHGLFGAAFRFRGSLGADVVAGATGVAERVFETAPVPTLFVAVTLKV